MARGRSTSSSPEPHRRRGKRDRRTSRRSRSPRRKSTGLPVETPSSSNTFETRYTLPKAWTPDDIYLDRQQEYKLTFPRRVIATAWSRELQIDHHPIEDVRLIDVLSRKQENWTLRLNVQNGVGGIWVNVSVADHNALSRGSAQREGLVVVWGEVWGRRGWRGVGLLLAVGESGRVDSWAGVLPSVGGERKRR